MLEKITLCSAASYSSEQKTTITDLNRVNIFYGHNGTGKSTIGNYLQANDELDYALCSTTYKGEKPEYLVFNERFIEKNFNQGWHPGVFTLNEDNIIAEQEISALEKESLELSAEKEEVITQGKNDAKKIENEKERLKTEAWKLKKQYDSGSLKYCFQKFNSDSSKFLEELLKLKTPSEIPHPPSELEQQARDIQSTDSTPKTWPSQVYFEAQNIEIEEIFEEVIVGTGESYLQALIAKLKNSDWVKQALPLIPLAEGKCPLCQQNAPADLEDQINVLFDETYKEKTKDIPLFEEKYRNSSNALIEKLRTEKQYKLEGDNKEALDAAIRSFEAITQANLILIQKKTTSPSEKITLTKSSNAIASINKVLKDVEADAKIYNEKILNKDEALTKIRNELWLYLRKEIEATNKSYEANKESTEKSQEEKRSKIKTINSRLSEISAEISKHRAQTSNIDKSIENINKQIQNLGLDGFKLEKYPGDLPRYRIIRGKESDSIFKTLSEGEKTLITFLYFIELCNGTEAAESKTSLSNRIIVIDDPISSLSHNHIYDIATLIHAKIIKSSNNYRQILILTHNLFFYHELIRQAGKKDSKKYKYYRVTKKEHSIIRPMGMDEIKNEYQSYWKVLLDAKEGLASPVTVPNMMRNILEYYFAFIHRTDKLEDTLEQLGESDIEFRPLWRYVNRGSHSDLININDLGIINPTKYMEKFREIFDKTGHIEHYLLMSGEMHDSDT